MLFVEKIRKNRVCSSGDRNVCINSCVVFYVRRVPRKKIIPKIHYIT